MCEVCSSRVLGRRGMIAAATTFVAALPFGRMAVAQLISAASTPDAALNLLVEGNARYVANQPRQRDFSAGRASRALRQAPFAAILACAD